MQVGALSLLAAALWSNTTLTALDVSGKRFTDSVVVALAKKFTTIERLAIRNNGGLKEDTIVACARAAPRLVSLDVDVSAR